MEVFGVVGPVGDDDLAGDGLDERCSEQNLAAVTGAGDQTDGIAEAVGGCVELGPEPAF